MFDCHYMYFHDQFEKPIEDKFLQIPQILRCKPPAKKAKKILGKHDLKLEIFLFSIFNSTAFAIPTIIIQI